MSRKRSGNKEKEGETSSKRRRQVPTQRQDDDDDDELHNLEMVDSDESRFLRSGKIIGMRLINFMCHSNLHVDFYNRANLIIGRNGSGKSAILTALVIGLGCKASVTNRGHNVKKLIQSGKNYCEIHIEITNNGQDSFEPEIYGDKIIVLRIITDSGTSQYKIKASDGRIVSKKLADLQSILLYHNIQPDNPVFVLNQDNAKTFLRKMDPSKNYDLFLKATQIDAILEELNECMSQHNECELKLQCHDDHIAQMKNEIEELNDKYQKLLSLEELKKNVSLQKIELLWAKVRDQQKLINDIKAAIHEKQKEMENLQFKMDNTTSYETGLHEKIQKLNEIIRDASDNLKKRNHTLNTLKAELRQKSDRLQEEKQNYDLLAEKIKRCNEEIKDLENNITTEANSSISRASKIQENEMKISETEDKIKELQVIIENTQRDLNLFVETRLKLQEDENEIQKKQQDLHNNNSHLQREIERIKEPKQDKLAIYGNYMSRLINRIENDYSKGLFSAKPRGPIGHYLEVPDKNLRSAVESVIGNGLLRTLIVNSSKDRHHLDKIISEVCSESERNIPIITTKFHNQVYDVSAGAVVAPHGTMRLMDAFKCTDPVVMNCLIDQLKVEAILFTNDKSLAEQLTENEENVPVNLLKIILLNPSMEYHPAPLYRAYSLKFHPPRFIQVNMTQKIKQLKEELRQNQIQYVNYDQQLKKNRKEFENVNEQYGKIRNNLEKFTGEMRNLTQNLKELRNVEFPWENEEEILKRELEAQKEEVAVYNQTYDNMGSILKQYQQEVIEKDKERKEEILKIRNYEDEIKNQQKEQNDLELELSSIRSNTRNWQDRIQEIKTDLEGDKEKLSEQETVYNSMRKDAQLSGEEIKSTQSVEELQDIIRKTNRNIKSASLLNEKIEDVKVLLESKQSLLERKELTSSVLKQTLHSLEMATHQRLKTIYHMKQHKALRLKHFFRMILSKRAFTGDISIDNHNKTLTLSVIPRDQHIDNAVSNTKSLSGGERSFTTTAFLLSLWSCVNHPFYFMDEIDVFTDQVNRRLIINLLLDEAKKFPYKQYTILTPQDVSFLSSDNLLKIHRLIDPNTT